MFLTFLFLRNFRSFQKKELNFSENTSLLIGPNASGKTNILEAIYLLSTGKSFRAQKESEMIKHGEEISRISGEITPFPKGNNSFSARLNRGPKSANLKESKNLIIVLTTGEVGGKKVAKKLYKVNGAGKRWRDFVGILKCVLFRPEDIEIILGSPSIRRNWLDSVLEQIDWQYRACNLTYQRALKQRNKLLNEIREGQAQKSQLIFWNQLLIKNGRVITKKREEMIEFFNNFLREVEIFYDKNTISLARLEKYSKAELALGMTLVGPQRDDITINAKCKMQKAKLERDLALFGSRGEQRMAILAMKLAELEFISQKTGQRPILLLDDIFSELDQNHRCQVLRVISKQQTLITTTDINLLDIKHRAKMNLVKI